MVIFEVPFSKEDILYFLVVKLSLKLVGALFMVYFTFMEFLQYFFPFGDILIFFPLH